MKHTVRRSIPCKWLEWRGGLGWCTDPTWDAPCKFVIPGVPGNDQPFVPVDCHDYVPVEVK